MIQPCGGMRKEFSAGTFERAGKSFPYRRRRGTWKATHVVVSGAYRGLSLILGAHVVEACRGDLQEVRWWEFITLDCEQGGLDVLRYQLEEP